MEKKFEADHDLRGEEWRWVRSKLACPVCEYTTIFLKDKEGKEWMEKCRECGWSLTYWPSREERAERYGLTTWLEPGQEMVLEIRSKQFGPTYRCTAKDSKLDMVRVLMKTAMELLETVQHEDESTRGQSSLEDP